MNKITFITGNKNKLNDIQKLMPEYQIEHIDFDAPEIQSLDTKEIVNICR